MLFELDIFIDVVVIDEVPQYAFSQSLLVVFLLLKTFFNVPPARIRNFPRLARKESSDGNDFEYYPRTALLK